MTATPQLMLNQKRNQASKLDMEFHMINIINAALSIRAQTEKTTFSSETLHIHWSGVRDLYIDEAHTALDIFHFAVFFQKECTYILILLWNPKIRSKSKIRCPIKGRFEKYYES